jgi:peroxiredoxin
VNDVFVMGAWADAQGSGDKVTLLADGNGEFARAIGLDFDGSNFGMGTRSQRFAAVVEDGELTLLNVEAPAKFEVSDADTILAAL